MKVAIVTGGARGIGKAIVKHLLTLDFHVVIIDVLEKQLLETKAELGENIDTYTCDITNETEVAQKAALISKKFPTIDCLINNAGITRDGIFLRMKKSDWDLVLNVNLTGTFNVTKAFLRPLLKNKNASIVNISSVVGVQGNSGQTNYSASKAGLLGLTKSLAQEYGKKGLRVNAIAPGFIETEMTQNLPQEALDNFMSQIPLNKPGTPEDVANLVGFLISPQAAYITGQTIRIDGGMITA